MNHAVAEESLREQITMGADLLKEMERDDYDMAEIYSWQSWITNWSSDNAALLEQMFDNHDRAVQYRTATPVFSVNLSGDARTEYRKGVRVCIAFIDEVRKSLSSYDLKNTAEAIFRGPDEQITDEVAAPENTPIKPSRRIVPKNDSLPRVMIPKAEAAEILQERIDAGQFLMSSSNPVPNRRRPWLIERTTWSEYNEILLRQMFSSDSYWRKYKSSADLSSQKNISDLYVKASIQSYLNTLSMIKEMLELIDEHPDLNSAPSQQEPAMSTPISRNVFIVHGHDISLRNEVSLLLHEIQLQPIVLAQKTNEGRTVIEKFEDHSDVLYAVVLLTPDDLGAVKTKPEELKPRARQNVILELGYFLAKLGRSKVCILYKGDVELPSDINGFVHISVDEGDSWRYQLGREIKQAGSKVGIVVDLDRLHG